MGKCLPTAAKPKFINITTQKSMKNKAIQFRGDPFNYIEALRKIGATFEVELSSASGKIKKDGKVYNFGQPWKFKDLGLFSSTKAALKKRPSHPTPPKERDYIGITPPEGSTFAAYENVIALDITAAYTSAAEILDFFPEELIKKHHAHNKRGRLKAFGATAKRAEVFSFKGGECEHTGVIEAETRAYFLTAAAYVGEVLREVQSALGKDFIFYWVDCAVFNNSPENIDKVKKIFEAYGFSYHFEPLDMIIYKREPKAHRIERYQEGGMKYYNFPIFDRAELKKLREQFKKQMQ